MLSVMAVENYRSLRDLVVPLCPLTVVTGANGSGKSSLYRVLRMLAETANGGAVAALANEGGLPSVRWAGPPYDVSPVMIRAGFAGEDYGYAVDFGLPPLDENTMFGRDPHIKTEAIWTGPFLRPQTALVHRQKQLVQWRGTSGGWEDSGYRLKTHDSILGEIADASTAPEVLAMRNQVRSWRFYDTFRTDVDAPARSSRPGTFTAVMANDGSDVASALQTVREVGLNGVLDEAIERAFPGSEVEIDEADGLFLLRLRQPGLGRSLSVTELSEGTLRYLLWTAALLSPRPPQLYVLNEPESSLHPDLLDPLASLIVNASKEAQTVVVTHSAQLQKALMKYAKKSEVDSSHVELIKDQGETVVADLGFMDRPAWKWPER